MKTLVLIPVAFIAFLIPKISPANWIEHSYVDEMTDVETRGAYSKRGGAHVGVECTSKGSSSGEIRFRFDAGEIYATPSESISFKLRVDKNELFDLSGKMFSNSHGSGFSYLKNLDAQKQKELLAQLISGNGYVIRYSRYGNTLTSRGSLRNSKSHILKVLNGCKYEHFEALTGRLGLNYTEYLKLTRKKVKQLAASKHKGGGEQLVRDKVRYIQSIQQRVNRKWINPRADKGDVSCLVRARQIPGGEIIDVNVVSCNGGGAELERSVERAVLKASPFPAAPDPRLFARVVEFVFEPQ